MAHWDWGKEVKREKKKKKEVAKTKRMGVKIKKVAWKKNWVKKFD